MGGNTGGVTRRNALTGAALILGRNVSALAGPRNPAPSEPRGDAVRSGAEIAVVRTTLGPVRGYSDRGIFAFKGLPYAEIASAAARFLPPIRPTRWTEVRSCMAYGPSAPQFRHGPQNDEQCWLYPRGFERDDDDCLRINIWSPGLGDGEDRPVMVWLHGGGFVNGSGNEMSAFDGRNLSARGDVVVVTLNHRLNLFGFLDFTSLDAQWSASENLGLQDIVSALNWVRANIRSFGGTPDNVTLFGQSGGGGKILALIGMPSARGLFHRAIVQSAPYFSAGEKSGRARFASKDAAATLALRAGQAFQSLGSNWPMLNSAMLVETLREKHIFPDLAPVEGGKTLPHHPLPPEKVSIVNDVPLMIGNTLHEASWSLVFSDNESFTRERAIVPLSKIFGAPAAALFDEAARLFPKAKPIEILDLLDPTRIETVLLADRMAGRSRFAVYNYVFSFPSPAFGGRVRAVHNSDIPYVFMNSDRWPEMTGGSSTAHQVAAITSDAWIAFSRTGAPQHAALPAWHRYDDTSRFAMFLDEHVQLISDYDQTIRRLLS